jgi:hypothetical protein
MHAAPRGITAERPAGVQAPEPVEGARCELDGHSGAVVD